MIITIIEGIGTSGDVVDEAEPPPLVWALNSKEEVSEVVGRGQALFRVS